ncbi:MAG: hypothetical protein M3N95_07080 [Actinomycetota bacterium]|nr:hypothetical protein [Actinomycetota bacterium]
MNTSGIVSNIVGLLDNLHEDEFTHIYDTQIDRVDFVGKAANGTPFLLAKSQGGLMDPAEVRRLIKAATPAQVAVFNEAGKLVGTVDPKKLVPITSAKAPDADLPDLTPAVPSTVGTKADEVAPAAGTESPSMTAAQAVAKAAMLHVAPRSKAEASLLASAIRRRLRT